MTCETALDRMLEVDVAELRASFDGELGRHLAECERCASVARTLVAELDRVDADLTAWAEAGDADVAVDRVLQDLGSSVAGRPSPESDRDRRAVRDRVSVRRRPWRWAWVPLAAAAIVAGVLLFPESEPEWNVPPEAPAFEPTVAVRVPADRSAAIMETANPDITIVWLFQEEET